MYITSTVNPLTRSNGDIPIIVLCHEETRKFIQRPETYAELVAVTREKFEIPEISIPIFTTSTLDICKSKHIEIDADVYPHLYTCVDEVAITIVEGTVAGAGSNIVTKTKGKEKAIPQLSTADAAPQPLNNFVEKHSIPVITTDQDKLHIPDLISSQQPLGGATFKEPKKPATQKYPKTPSKLLPERTQLLSSAQSTRSDQTLHKTTSRPAVKGRTAQPSSPNGAGPSPIHQHDQVGVKEDFFLYPPSTSARPKMPHLHGEPEVKEEKVQVKEEKVQVKEEKQPPSSSPPPQLVKDRLTRAYDSRREPIPSASMRVLDGAQAMMKDTHYNVRILAPEGQEAEFKTRGKHTIKKVLMGACNNFSLDYDRARLLLLLDEAEGEQDMFYCEPEETMASCGIWPDATLVIQVVESEDEAEDDEHERQDDSSDSD